jgi:hypothetical protein
MNPFDPAQMRDESASTPESHVAKRRRRMSRRGFFLRGMSAIGLSGTNTGAYAAAIEPGRLVTTSYRLTPPGWRSGRLTVAAIADLHAGGPNMTVAHIRRVVDATKRCGPARRLCRRPQVRDRARCRAWQISRRRRSAGARWIR